MKKMFSVQLNNFTKNQIFWIKNEQRIKKMENKIKKKQKNVIIALTYGKHL